MYFLRVRNNGEIVVTLQCTSSSTVSSIQCCRFIILHTFKCVCIILLGTEERNRGYALMMKANKSKTALHRASTFSLLALHGCNYFMNMYIYYNFLEAIETVYVVQLFAVIIKLAFLLCVHMFILICF